MPAYQMWSSRERRDSSSRSTTWRAWHSACFGSPGTPASPVNLVERRGFMLRVASPSREVFGNSGGLFNHVRVCRAELARRADSLCAIADPRIGYHRPVTTAQCTGSTGTARVQLVVATLPV